MNKKDKDKIKYDKLDVQILLWVSIISGFFFVLGIWQLFQELLANAMFPFILFYLGGFVFISSLLRFYCAKIYLRRLAKGGYELPDRKKRYDGLLRNLPRTKEEIDLNGGNRSKKTAIFCLIVWGLCQLYQIMFVCSWSFYGTAKDAAIMLSVADFIWLILALLFFVQRNEKKYKEDIEIDALRKNRFTKEDALIFLCALLFATFIIKLSFASMTQYIYGNHVVMEREMLDVLQNNMAQIYEESKDDISSWQNTYDALSEGTDLISWGTPDDIFKQKLADYYEIQDFSEYGKRFKIAKGTPIIFCTLDEDGVFHAYLKNPIEKVTMEKLIGLKGE